MAAKTAARTTIVAAVGTTALLLTSPAALAAGDHINADGPLASYDATAVPTGASAHVDAVYTGDGRSIVTLHVRGLLPGKTYDAHAHVNACGAAGADAGGHFQHDLSAGATDANEIWLGFTTNAAGNGLAQTVVDWQFTPDRRAHSVIIHDPAGMPANKRIGCLTVEF